MTVYQKQCLLAYLGYYRGTIDGIDGPQTRAALEKFRQDYGLGEEGLIGAVAGTLAKKTSDKQPETSDNYIHPEALQYLRSDGYFHIPRGVDCQITKNFRAREIHCQGVGCCTESVISMRIMCSAQAIRDEIDEPLEIGGAGGSGYRCLIHNPLVGGAPNSLHVLSDAVDLHYKNPQKLKAVALHHIKDGEVGVYSWGCHVGRWDRGYVSQFVGG